MPHIDFPQSACEAACTCRDITPPAGIYHRMWGAATHERATGVHRPLTATVLALRSISPSDARAVGEMQILAAIDHCLLWNADMALLRRRVCDAVRVDPRMLHIAFTHTHAAGLMDPGRADLPGGELIAPYLEQLAKHIADATSEAISGLRPARIVYGTGRCNLAANRDLWDAERGIFVCGFNPTGAADDTLLVARIDDMDARPIATVVNYACHPTTLAWDNTLVSPDFVGATRAVVEGQTAAPCLFLQGASGDLGPREGFVGDVAVADRNGRQLGFSVLATLESLPPAGVRFEYAGPVVSGATIGTWKYVLLGSAELPAKQRWQCRRFTVDLDYRADLPDRDETKAALAVWQQQEQLANERQDRDQARDCRAQVERMTRQIARLNALPEGRTLPLEVSLWQMGDAIWLLLEGEHYQCLQRELRRRFAGHPLIVATVTDGWRPGYLPAAETYGKGIYQESIAVLAPGSLERLIEAIAAEIAATSDLAPA